MPQRQEKAGEFREVPNVPTLPLTAPAPPDTALLLVGVLSVPQDLSLACISHPMCPEPYEGLARLASPLWHPQSEALLGCTPPAANTPPGPTGTQVSQSLLARARCYALLGQRKTALLDFNSALQAEPESVAALCGRGVLHLGLGRQQVRPWGHRCLQTK